ncbi:inositol monophosphatase [Haladaptatus sp. F3-133]|jgi:myo-inositol-1(or 4)-monophosphatase|uniref:fructose-bisphosphatase n=1 Tax=Halorutilus salinus TaxID=2487751 RepID=A0A9Q4C445_9EURY|nr:inositol monophosphatase family protein [Halorutilus salinus]MCX2818908.1 inositol monophosphatase [Halorutilus salinus]
MLNLCKEIADAVHEVVEPALGDPGGGEVVGMGADGTPTKRIDEVAEERALEVVDGYDDLRVVTEEAGERVYGDPTHTVVLDPVDGTYNATHGIPLHSVSVGIADGDSVDDMQYAYVRELNTGRSYTAERGEGAYFEGEPLSVSGESTPAKMTVGGVYNIEGFDPTEFDRLRLLGCSSLELCYVAAGRLDAFVDMRAYLRVVDFAAAKLVIEEAGGVVTDGYGDKLHQVVTPEQRSSVVAASPEGHESTLEVLGVSS